jgi:hypothetical protein
MRRAILGIALMLSAAAILAGVSDVSSEGVNIVNGVGLLDYTRKPDFKVGDWVRYHITARSALGAHDDYMITLLIAGEENLWGEDCFWVETWTEPVDRAPLAIATLMSFAIYDDSLAFPRMQLYQRKTISDIDEHGIPVQVLSRRSGKSLKSRSPIDTQIAWSVDTLGADTVMVPSGTFQCKKVKIRQGKGAQTDVRDSTVYTEVHDERTDFLAREIPLTSLAREDIDYWFSRRTWQIGHSLESAPLQLIERSTGQARLVGYGHGLKARLLLPEMQKSIRGSQAAAGTAPARRSPAARPRSSTPRR